MYLISEPDTLLFCKSSTGVDSKSAIDFMLNFNKVGHHFVIERKVYSAVLQVSAICRIFPNSSDSEMMINHNSEPMFFFE
jgi:hypothetical protein